MQIIARGSRAAVKGAFRRLKRQPLVEVLGLLAVAAAAKSGYGGLAAGGALTLVPLYFGAAVPFMATRALAAWVGRVRLYELVKLQVQNAGGRA